MNGLAAVFSWKAYKLSYSALFAFKLRPATFTSPKVFRDMQRKATYFNIAFTYSGMILLAVVGMIDLDWGTQLYMLFRMS